MALIKCPDCKKEISDKSTVCIHCGCPIDSVEEIQSVTPFESVAKDLPEKKKKKPFLIIGIIISIVAVIAVVIILIANAGVEVPRLYDVTEETAVNILTSNSLIPNVIYEYDDEVKEGTVIHTEPWYGEKVPKNSTIQVVISKGPRYISAKNSNIEWWHVDYYVEDDWNFYTPYIQDGYLYIECNPIFGTSFDWKNDGFGNASINDTFSKSVPLDLEVSDTHVVAGVEQNIKFIIPVNDLDVKKPTTLYTLLNIERNGKSEQIKVNFTISW